MNVSPTVSNGLASISQRLTVTTNIPTGYRLTLSTPTTPEITTSSGTITTPLALSNNTWGYALARGNAVGVTNNFDISYSTPVPSITSKWANPSTNTTIKNTSTATTSDSTDIYYGVKVDALLPSGTYTNKVEYTVIANPITTPTTTITSVTPSSGGTAGGTAIAIVGTGFTLNDTSITTAVTVGGSNCTNVSISSNTPTIGQDTIYCNTSSHSAGTVSVSVTTWNGTVTKTSSYTYIAPANVTYVSPSIASTIAGTESGPAFTILGSGFSGTGSEAVTSVTIGGIACSSFQVVSDTQIFCKAPNTINTAGSKAVVVTKSNVAGTSSATVTYNSTAYPTFQSINCTTVARLHRDTRDSQLYYLKRMPDNKCWMVDNLKYANYGTFSPEGGKNLTVDGTNTQNATNINVAKYVDPGATSYCIGNTNMPANTNTRCGLLYNWYTATRGTGTYATSVAGTNITGNICPANFRLPSSTSGTGGPTTNGTATTVADFPVLNASMNAGSLATGTTTDSYFANWHPTGLWGGTFSGRWVAAIDSQSETGFFWSSTASSATGARYLFFNKSLVYTGGYSTDYKYLGFAVRCVL